ncbi:MAG: hypothetical protein KDD73_04475 [Anaerolineales bacterium]|nr:hypothetical protein [Anaerolineales bacterium]MCB9128967.1 hypothetical protein [Ardenticatenales bacterium]
MERIFGVVLYLLGYIMLSVTIADALSIAELLDDTSMALFMGIGYLLCVVGFLFNRRSSELAETFVGMAVDDWMGFLMFFTGIVLIMLTFLYALGLTSILDPWRTAGVPVFVSLGILFCVTGFMFARATMSTVVGRVRRKY